MASEACQSVNLRLGSLRQSRYVMNQYKTGTPWNPDLRWPVLVEAVYASPEQSRWHVLSQSIPGRTTACRPTAYSVRFVAPAFRRA